MGIFNFFKKRRENKIKRLRLNEQIALLKRDFQEGIISFKHFKELQAKKIGIVSGIKEAWENAGFDYIPVEPILIKNNKLRAYKTKNGDYRVFTKILGPNLFDFLSSREGLKFNSKLRSDQITINATLRKLRIFHGHEHIDQNYCIEIYEEKPRLYIIDFDMAEIT